MVDGDGTVVDIGCDHGLLDIYLACNNPNLKIIATDISSRALNQAIDNINKYKLGHMIETRVGNGLDIIKDNKIDTIIMAGMGGISIIDILSNPLVAHINKIIVAPNTDIYLVRQKLSTLGFMIINEHMILERHKYYTIIKAYRGIKHYNFLQLRYGPVLLKTKEPIFLKYLADCLNHDKTIMKKIPWHHFKHRYQLYKEIKTINKILK